MKVILAGAARTIRQVFLCVHALSQEMFDHLHWENWEEGGKGGSFLGLLSLRLFPCSKRLQKL